MNLAQSLLTALKDHGARQVFGSATDPVRTVIVGFLDRVDLA